MYDIKKFVGNKIRDFRNERGWSQEELAHKAGVHRAYIGQLERGEKNVTIESLDKIITALKISFSELFNTDENYVVLSDMINKLSYRSIDDQKLIMRLINDLIDWKYK